MLLRIEISQLDPPVGEATVDDIGIWIPFRGWLELIAGIERIVQSARLFACTPGASDEMRR